eukprot:2909947-Pyramimonas_sp.AAC.1
MWGASALMSASLARAMPRSSAQALMGPRWMALSSRLMATIMGSKTSAHSRGIPERRPMQRSGEGDVLLPSRGTRRARRSMPGSGASSGLGCPSARDWGTRQRCPC